MLPPVAALYQTIVSPAPGVAVPVWTRLSKQTITLPADGAFVAIEGIIDDNRNQNVFGMLMSLNMLIETGRGFDYTFADYNKWAKIAGFSRTNAETPSTITILEALTYGLSSRLILDGGCYQAAHGNLPRVTFFAGITYSVGNLYRLWRRQ